MANHIEIRISCGGRDEADRIAEALIERRLAASVQQVDIRSRYRWRGAVREAEEVLVLVRTVADRYADVEATVLELHSYEIPSVTSVDIVDGHDAYLAWLEDEIS